MHGLPNSFSFQRSFAKKMDIAMHKDFGRRQARLRIAGTPSARRTLPRCSIDSGKHQCRLRLKTSHNSRINRIMTSKIKIQQSVFLGGLATGLR